jgi:hypothetical protein
MEAATGVPSGSGAVAPEFYSSHGNAVIRNFAAP